MSNREAEKHSNRRGFGKWLKKMQILRCIEVFDCQAAVTVEERIFHLSVVYFAVHFLKMTTMTKKSSLFLYKMLSLTFHSTGSL